MMNDRFKTRIIHLTPIVVSLLVGVLCAFLILNSTIELYGVTPFPESPAGSFGNAFYFVILVGVGASLIYLLLKWKGLKLINLITGFVLTIAVFMLSLVYLFAAFSRFVFFGLEVFIFALALGLTALADVAIFRNHVKASNLAILCLGGALGTFLGASIPSLSTFLILGFLAVYDVFTVYHGPVGKIARSGLEHLRGLSFSFRDLQMGLGDLTFYSMLSGHMLLYFGFVSCLASIAGILVGCLLAFRMLERKGMFPGLPFPIFFGLLFGLAASLL
jgi:presenilin-like A22 family membrane protease